MNRQKIACNCKNITYGMIEDAIREFDLDPDQCILFGDKPWDVEAGKRCGISGVFIKERLEQSNDGQ